MLGIDWPVWVGIGLVIAWKTLRVFKPSWASQLKEIDSIAHSALDLALIAASANGWGGLKAKLLYIAKAEAELSRKGLPTNHKAIEHLEKVWHDHLLEQSAKEVIDQITSGKATNLLPPSMRDRKMNDE